MSKKAFSDETSSSSTRREMTFLSPIGIEAKDEYTIWVCADEKELEFSRLEISYAAVESSDGDEQDPDCMVTFHIGGDEVRANKFILAARSNVFRAQLFGKCEEAATGTVAIEGFSKSAFECFLTLLRDCSSDAACKIVHSRLHDVPLVEVYALADKYCVQNVRSVLQASILHSVTPDNVRNLLEQCRQHQASTLADGVCDVAVARFPKQKVVQLLRELAARV